MGADSCRIFCVYVLAVHTSCTPAKCFIHSFGNGDVSHTQYPIVNRLRKKSGPKCSDRKSTRLNSSHSSNSYAVFCLKKIYLFAYSVIPSARTHFLSVLERCIF